MTPEQQRIAIAEACGWKQVQNADRDLSEPHLTRCWREWLGPNGEQDSEPPDYLNDLNAMHSAEEWLETNHPAQCLLYKKELMWVIGGKSGCGDFRLIHATSGQRASAFCKILGLWKDAP